jgi:hypothetical protein
MAGDVKPTQSTTGANQVISAGPVDPSATARSAATRQLALGEVQKSFETLGLSERYAALLR